MATSGRSCRSRKRRREATFGRAAGCRRAPATGARDARGRSPGHCWRARIGPHRRGHRRPRRCDIALRAGEQAWGEAHRDGHIGAVMAADLQIADRQEVRNRQARDAYDRHRRLRNRPGREVWLELDDGKQVHLRPHDVVVQNGTRHAWRNKRDRPVKMAFVLIGARRNA